MILNYILHIRNKYSYRKSSHSKLKWISNSAYSCHLCWSQTIFAAMYIFPLSVLSSFIKPIKSSFDQTTKAGRQLFSRKSAKLPSSTLDWLQPLSLIFLQAVTIHCLWHSPVGSLTPFNQINFIFLSMPCNWMSQMGRDVTWFRMSIFKQQFYLQFLQDVESWQDVFI